MINLSSFIFSLKKLTKSNYLPGSKQKFVSVVDWSIECTGSLIALLITKITRRNTLNFFFQGFGEKYDEQIIIT